MRRVPHGPVRDGWRLTNYSLGLTYNDTELPDGTMMSYWQEGPYYEFTQAEVEETLPRLEPPAGKPYGWMDAAAWTRFARYLAGEGQLDPIPPTDELLTNELLPE